MWAWEAQWGVLGAHESYHLKMRRVGRPSGMFEIGVFTVGFGSKYHLEPNRIIYLIWHSMDQTI